MQVRQSPSAIQASSSVQQFSVMQSLHPGEPRLQSVPQASVAGYSFGGLLNAPTLTGGTVEATTGLQGETYLDRLDLAHFESDAGGPLLGESGDVLGILNPRDTSGDRQLPTEVSFVTDNLTITEFLRETGAQYSVNLTSAPKSGIELERIARDVTVWINCWE